MAPPRILIITPARDEAEHLPRTIASMAAQTTRPVRWVIVDDGSTDETRAIAEQASADHDWITVVSRPDRGARVAGSGVMEAFMDGLDAAGDEAWDFLVKLDADLSFDDDYFEQCMRRFEENPRLGIGGGVIHNLIDGAGVLEEHPEFHVRGATKIYRRACWDDLGGLVPIAGWDTIDEVKARMLDWETRSFSDVVITQLRPTGEAAGQWRNWWKNGRASFLIGYHPLFILVKSIRRTLVRPYFVGSAGLLAGFFSTMLRRERRVDDLDLIRFIRREQLKRLVGLKSVWR